MKKTLAFLALISIWLAIPALAGQKRTGPPNAIIASIDGCKIYLIVDWKLEGHPYRLFPPGPAVLPSGWSVVNDDIVWTCFDGGVSKEWYHNKNNFLLTPAQ